jgi:hypothetical protein
MGIHFFLTFTMYVRPVSVKKNVYVRITDRTVRLHIRSMAQQKRRARIARTPRGRDTKTAKYNLLATFQTGPYWLR